ncbi:hypothetical protein [Umezakia ovalisporum]|uniref:hypothetical protein n=1 Tax=Umezakia ovalisporum TaxID=75695 RepID=UPI0024756E51|nr:hypothetical protein [Umezakia ovalisporum]MDH6087277.1 hypothetical protein [Umezakia ovalisporum Ak1311]
MSKNYTSNQSFLFRCLSEEEQENLTGGQSQDILGNSNFLFQKTDIQTEADNHINLTEDESGSQSTKYTLSQITIASSISFTLPSVSSHSNSPRNLISKIINGVFSSITT